MIVTDEYVEPELSKHEKILRVKASLFADLLEAITPVLNKYGMAVTGEDYDFYQALINQIKVAQDKTYSNQHAQAGFKRGKNVNYPGHLDTFR